MNFFILFLLLFSHSLCKSIRHSEIDSCDDTVNGIGIEWDGEDDKINSKFYKCYLKLPKTKLNYVNESCFSIDVPYHYCVSKKIIYSSSVPTSGSHRPNWPVYGEYLYCPPQRWLHALEHGAVVFLYDPCADEYEIEIFRSIAQKCLRRFILTPHSSLENDSLFTIVTYGCKLELTNLIGNEKIVTDYIKVSLQN
ncbi:unnamed protein product [Brachionus calyciflorus]|uniref:DUF3105 domain-containing protein n=1 Tax=Brachionus calyciflorus TaxID=104777 RepID=A0A814C1L8_9BILA|nr:unnamed protein product [Brachionus calyciflorus]